MFAGRQGNHSVRAIVCAFDPLQLEESITDSDYESLAHGPNRGVHWLRRLELIGRRI
jgi:hypothetical protein